MNIISKIQHNLIGANKSRTLNIDNDYIDVWIVTESQALTCIENFKRDRTGNFKNSLWVVYYILVTHYSFTDPFHVKLNKYGKPFLIYNKAYKFNISHSDNLLAIAISLVPIGIDVEQINSFELYDELYDFCLHKDEIKFVKYSNINTLINFYKIWTAKEAVLKFLGLGLSAPLSNLKVNLEYKFTIFKTINTLNDQKIQIEHLLHLPENFIGCIAFSQSINEINYYWLV